MRHPLSPLHPHPSITSPLERKTESSCFVNDTVCELRTTGWPVWRCPSFPTIPAVLGTKSLPTAPVKTGTIPDRSAGLNSLSNPFPQDPRDSCNNVPLYCPVNDRFFIKLFIYWFKNSAMQNETPGDLLEIIFADLLYAQIAAHCSMEIA